MEYARRIISPGEEQLVSITEMQQLGEERARSYTYKCPDLDCTAKVFAAFPEEQKSGRHKAPRPYFSAKTEKAHVGGCQRDRMIEREEKVRRMRATMVLTPEAEALLAKYPMRFDESNRIQKQEDTEAGGTTDPSNDKSEGGVRGSGAPSPSERESIRSSRHIRRFVEVYENFPAQRSLLPIKIQGCPAETYARAFVDIAKAAKSDVTAKPRYIFYGKYSGHKYSNVGTTVIFTQYAHDKNQLGIWIPNQLKTHNLWQSIILKRLVVLARGRRARNNIAATIYVIGKFEPWQDWKYSITLTQLGQMWISFPDDYQHP